MRKLTRSKLRKAAKLAMAIHGYDLMQGMLPAEVGLTHEEHAIMQEEAMKIAERLAGKNPMNFGGVEQCIEYFR